MSERSRLGFSGHETFPFRYGWLKKAAHAVGRDAGIFGQERALVVLGVGKNMVLSIRHWSLASQLLEEGPERTLRLTRIGELLLDQWDPHLEDPASLWVVHWLLVSSPARAATWHLAFHRFPRPEFTKAELADFVLNFAERNGTKVKPATVARDVDCLVRTYIAARGTDRQLAEDSFDCPLVELGLLHQLRDGETCLFEIGPKVTLPAAVFGFALCDYVGRLRPESRAIPVHDLLYRPGSPGQAFKLDQNSVADYLENLGDLTSGAIQLDETAGLVQAYWLRRVEPLQLLQAYYERGVDSCPGQR